MIVGPRFSSSANANLAVTAGLIPGAVVDVSLKDGANATYHKLTNTTVMSTNPDNPNTGGAHRDAIQGHGGHLVAYSAVV